MNHTITCRRQSYGTVYTRDYEMPPGMRMQPRFRVWLDQTGGGTLHDYVRWITQQWADWRAETAATQTDQEAFDAWLTQHSTPLANTPRDRL